MIYARPGENFTVVMANASTGLVGQVGVRVLNGQGDEVVARSTSNIIELVPGSGSYAAIVKAPTTPGQYTAFCDDGKVTPETTTAEEVLVTTQAFPPTGVTLTFSDRLRRAIQDGQTSDGESMSVARLEDLTEQVMQQATPTGVQFAVRFAATPTQGYASTFVSPATLVAFVDGNPAPITPTVDVDANGVFTLAAPPAETLLVSYTWEYLQQPTIEAFLDEARAWVAGPATFPTLEDVPDGLVPAVIDFAAARALRSLAAKLQLASAKAGDAGMDWSDITKAYTVQAKERAASAAEARKSYYSRADQTLAPASAISQIAVGGPITPIR